MTTVAEHTSALRAALTMPCRCGHLSGDHAIADPRPCLAFDRRQQVLFGAPRCSCQAFDHVRPYDWSTQLCDSPSPTSP